jgi:DNA repair exonuclease SbcCD ATPase subunit
MKTLLQKRIEDEEAEIELMIKAQNEAAGITEAETPEEVTSEEEIPDQAPTKPEEKLEDTTDWKKRYSDLRSHTTKVEKELKDKLAELETKINSGTVETKAPETIEEVSVWRKDNPKASRILEALIEDEIKKNLKGTEEELQEIQRDRKKLKKETAESKIRKAHEDYDEIKESAEFHDWVASKAKWMQDAVYENTDDPDILIEVLDFYKVKKNKTKVVEASAADAVNVKGAKSMADPNAGAKKKFTESWVDSLSPAEYERMADEIDEAIRSGNFIYDKTKKK